jgi:hypothetical protein
MFALEDSDGRLLDAGYSQRRMRNEPLVELTQFKGTSETHTALSSDELADFELWNTTVGAPEPIEPAAGGYVRNAYQRGLALEERDGHNPFKFGVIGSSDTHNASSAVEEAGFTGGHGNADSTAQVRLHSRPSTLASSSLAFSAAGLAGVWAESNTRAAIFDALRRKETFATSGSRIRVRFFAGAAYPADLAERADAIAVAYRDGVPMGGDLVVTTGKAAPRFFAWATRDPRSAPLQRLQVVKVWVEDGEPRERIFDIACSNGIVPDPATRRCADNGATVDVSTCSFSADRGAAELKTVWRDPEWDGSRRAAYYLRVVENPTCRWSTWDAVRLGEPLPSAVAPTLQERAWSSPIWTAPAAAAATSR